MVSVLVVIVKYRHLSFELTDRCIDHRFFALDTGVTDEVFSLEVISGIDDNVVIRQQ
ncbi:hypothetical protein D3C75_1330980 [compost metagenome]